MGDRTSISKETFDALVEGCRNVYWLASELQMFRNRPEFTRALEQIDKALKDATGIRGRIVKE